jgi:hypothetical protein
MHLLMQLCFIEQAYLLMLLKRNLKILHRRKLKGYHLHKQKLLLLFKSEHSTLVGAERILRRACHLEEGGGSHLQAAHVLLLSQ